MEIRDLHPHPQQIAPWIHRVFYVYWASLIAEKCNTRPTDVWGWGLGVDSRQTSFRTGYLYLPLRTDMVWMELREGRFPCMQRPRTYPLAHSSYPMRPSSIPHELLSVSCPPLWPQEYEIMREILLLQVAAKNYNLNPEEQFGAWFRDMERLSEKER